MNRKGHEKNKESEWKNAGDLSPLVIPDAVSIPRGDTNPTRYGVGNAAINDGLNVFVEPYDIMTIGDKLSVYWGAENIPWASADVTAENLNCTVGLKLPKANFSAGNFQPYYRLQRTSGGSFDSSTLNVSVKLTLPGGPDPDPSTPNINENMAAPQVPDDVAQNGVDASRAVQGVDVVIKPYLYMAEYDYIDFSWGGQHFAHLVQPNEVGKPVVIHVGQEEILAAGDGEIKLMYRVIDAEDNFSDGWSLATVVDVSANGSELDPPIVENAVGGVLDIASLDGKDATVNVLLVTSQFALGETVELIWAGHTASGSSVDWSDAQVIGNVPDDMLFAVPFTTVVAISQGYAVVSYTLHKTDGTKVRSRRTQVQVTGAVQRLAAPDVQEAAGGMLAADVTQATVEIAPYTGMAAGDLVTLVWSGLMANGQPTDYRPEYTVSGATVGDPVTFAVPGAAQVAPLDGGGVTVWYQVTPADGLSQVSESLKLSVGQAPAVLTAPTVAEAVDGVLAPDVKTATVVIAPYTGMAAGDRVNLLWVGDRSDTFTDFVPVSVATVGHTLTFDVSGQENVAPNSSAQVSYYVARAAGDTETSAVLQLNIGQARWLPAPTIDEAQGTRLNPVDVPDGATVRVPAQANLQAGDLVTVRWTGTPGTGSGEYRHDVTGSDAGHAIMVTVPAAVVVADEGNSISLDYKVDRVSGGAETSDVAVYEVIDQPNTGNLKVMGARSARSLNWLFLPSTTRLTALDAGTLEPVEATWLYDGDSDEGAVKATSFRDTEPARLLHVSTAHDRVTLNIANLCGCATAMAARCDEGNVVAWGYRFDGGEIPSDIARLTNVVAVAAGAGAFAARCSDGTVVAWGAKDNGGNVPEGIASLTDVVGVVGSGATSKGAFAAWRKDGTVVAWGDINSGGNVPERIAQLTDVIDVVGSGQGFAARRDNGSVVSWGSGFDSATEHTDIIEVVGGELAFAARRTDGTVEAWGDADHGGRVPSDIAELRDITVVVSGGRAFAALRSNGSVVAWGDSGIGGNVPADIARLTDIVDVTGNGWAFAALRADGSVAVWGDGSSGGSVRENVSPLLTDVVQVVGTAGEPGSHAAAFAALRRTGQVVAWGSGYAADTSAVADTIRNVRAVYGGGDVFAALRDDRDVVTWGDPDYGGDSSATHDQLDGSVSYETTPTSRGIGCHALAT